MIKIIGIIPARYASTRFPGKPLIDIGGKSMIQRVYEQSAKANSLADVIVATDDKRIQEHVVSFGGKVVMTKDSHQSGTDRCFEAIEKFDPAADVVINIQGDEPFIHPEQIDIAAKCFSNPEVKIATLAKKLNNNKDLFNPNVPKVIIDKNGNAIYFSRHPIPYMRGKENDTWQDLHTFYKHIGLYAYRTNVLAELTALKQSSLELAESLEQLRWLENGYKIKVEITDYESVAIDAPDDLKKLENFL